MNDDRLLRFGLYARKSSESDERQVESIDDQTNVLFALAKQHGLRVSKTYSEARSAKEPDRRDEFRTLMLDLERGVIDAVVCWNVDRLSRNPVDSGYISWLLQKGIIKCIKTPYREYRPEDNVVVFAVETSGANQQIIELSRNVRRGLEEKAARGIWPLKPPVGYCSDEIIINGRVRHQVIVDAERFTLLRRAWDLMLTGSYTGVQVMEAMNAWGYLSPKSRSGRGGQPMKRATMYAHFKQPFYFGYFRYKGKLMRGSHRPLVSKSEFDAVQRILGRENGIRPQKHEFPFTGLIRCGKCRCFVTAEQHIKHYRTTGNHRTYIYYHCGNRNGCRVSVTEQFLEVQLEAWTAAMRFDTEVAQYVESVLKRDLDERPTVGIVVSKEREAALELAKTRLDTLFEMRQNGEISSAEFVPRKDKCISDIAGMEAAAVEALKHRERVLESLRNGIDFLVDCHRQFMDGGHREKRQVATLLAEEYSLTDGVFAIKPHPLLDLLRQIEPPENDGDMVRADALPKSSPALSAWRDYIRTLLSEGREIFPKLPEFVSITDPGRDSSGSRIGQAG